MTASELVPADGPSGLDLATFEAALMRRLADSGLPSDGVLVPARQRILVFHGMDDALAELNEPQRLNSLYLSKFFAAVSAGLFDAALNYLWDETVNQLRQRVSAYDLSYFYDLAVGPTSDLRKKLSTSEDLSKVEDQKLIQAANKMGLLSDVSLQQIDLVRYMRNHASAAHPNHVELRALQLLNFLETCIVEVMTMRVDGVVIEIKRLLENIKKDAVESSDVPVIAATFDKMPEGQANNLGNGLFGIYTRIGTDEQTKANVRLLMPKLWPYLSDDTHRQFGVRAARFRANQDKEQAGLARELLETVDAVSFLPDDIRVPEIDAAIEMLLSTHAGWDNFTNEYAPAVRLAELVGNPPAVPKEVMHKYVDSLVWVFLTNGAGESWSANPIYEQLLRGLTVEEASYALTSFCSHDIALRLNMERPQKKFRQLLDVIDGKIVGRQRRELLSALKDFAGSYSKAKYDAGIKKLLDAISAT
ncbi:hypothetical protein [Streptomyces sp. NPDC058228]|uniref:hypothetical protein n=1 Tax=Streptomyces sp. NPDC058228 TaxID=3346390 RepID=UPI0036E91B26